MYRLSLILKDMKIRLSELRRIIRETLSQQGWPPGRWYPGTGEPVSRDAIGLMGTAGLGRDEDRMVDEDPSLDEIDEGDDENTNQ